MPVDGMLVADYCPLAMSPTLGARILVVMGVTSPLLRRGSCSGLMAVVDR